MVFYNEKQQLYLDINALGVGLVASLLQVRDRMWISRHETPNYAVLQQVAFESKILTSMETLYIKIEREALDIHHDLETFHYFCFTCKVCMITITIM